MQVAGRKQLHPLPVEIAHLCKLDGSGGGTAGVLDDGTLAERADTRGARAFWWSRTKKWRSSLMCTAWSRERERVRAAVAG